MDANLAPTKVSRYLDYLPAIFQHDDDARGVSFLGRFLLAFEHILSAGDLKQPGLEEIIDRLHTYFIPLGEGDAGQAPGDFLPWLAGWVALTLRDDWREDERRRFLANIVPLYRLRGTKAGLEQMLRIYTGMGVEIYELLKPMRVGMTSHVGVDTAVGGALPYYFIVRMILNKPESKSADPNSVDPYFERRVRIARAIIEQEKPAYTYYDLQVVLPTIQIGFTSKIGTDTLIGTPT